MRWTIFRFFAYDVPSHAELSAPLSIDPVGDFVFLLVLFAFFRCLLYPIGIYGSEPSLRLLLYMLFASTSMYTFYVFRFFTACTKRVGGARGLGAAVVVMLCMNTVAACNVGRAIVLSCGRRRAFLRLVVFVNR